MSRKLTNADIEAVLRVAKASGLFESDQLGALRETFERSQRGLAERDEIWLGEVENDELIGVAYAASELMTDRVWNLLFIAVHPDGQGQGTGGKMLKAVESELRSRNTRMNIIETASGDDFELTR